ncbi:glycoside hydrolase family 3 N-terminal domain-containing protein [Isoptericola sp. AK164]|uniref:glycoside hydrolase family 3 protein n=1 Tax=Isoptericola sp. AK164 TaxID=3024246 RepID=UPI002418A3B9|nr:glycoside hydrolase family 3 N-terminal domain-containing protein [Isoptericola sp. AK164]
MRTATDDAVGTGAVPPDAPYRDRTRPVGERVTDLLGRMTVAEKAGQLFHTMIETGPGGTLAEEPSPMGVPATSDMLLGRHMTHFNVLASPATAEEFARWHNRLQDLAASTRLGIPVTVSSDPRHAFTDNPGTALLAGPFSQWPETPGLAAVGDPGLVEEQADAVRREYLAVGIRTALHPQVDLATEPRWSRAAGTFGEDPAAAGRLGAAAVHGLQGTGAVARRAGLPGTFGPSSLSTMTKHFLGGGPQADGEDPHFAYGREQVYPGGAFATHLAPFTELIAAGTRQMMPYYGMPVGLEVDGEAVEPVGFAFNRQVLTGLLRERLGFDGIVCTDWGLVNDAEILGTEYPARAWGVEGLDPLERVERILAAGADQLGGEACPELVVELVRTGRVPEERLDVSVARLLREKFVLGLFDDARYVDVDAASAVVGHPELVAAGRRAQSRSVTVLSAARRGPAALPAARGLRVWLEGADDVTDVSPGLVTLVDSPEEADVALLRLKAPYEARGDGFEAFFHAGSLDFPAEVLSHVAAVSSRVPTVVDVYLDRPAVLAPVLDALGSTGSLVANFGASTGALLDALTGVVRPEGRLPFDLPRSMAAVEASREDVPFDTADPLFRCGHGLSV